MGQPLPFSHAGKAGQVTVARCFRPMQNELGDYQNQIAELVKVRVDRCLLRLSTCLIVQVEVYPNKFFYRSSTAVFLKARNVLIAGQMTSEVFNTDA